MQHKCLLWCCLRLLMWAHWCQGCSVCSSRKCSASVSLALSMTEQHAASARFCLRCCVLSCCAHVCAGLLYLYTQQVPLPWRAILKCDLFSHTPLCVHTSPSVLF
jgi:hypothetical protein